MTTSPSFTYFMLKCYFLFSLKKRVHKVERPGQWVAWSPGWIDRLQIWRHSPNKRNSLVLLNPSKTFSRAWIEDANTHLLSRHYGKIMPPNVCFPHDFHIRCYTYCYYFGADCSFWQYFVIHHSYVMTEHNPYCNQLLLIVNMVMLFW